jgi:hypothetical protein
VARSLEPNRRARRGAALPLRGEGGDLARATTAAA